MSCNSSSDEGSIFKQQALQEEKEFYFNEFVDGNFYIMGSESTTVSGREKELLFRDYGLIWKGNSLSVVNNEVKSFLDSVILAQKKETSREILLKVKEKGDSLNLILDKYQSIYGEYFYAETSPKLVCSRDSLDDLFTLRVDSLRRKESVLISYSVDTLGVISNIIFVRKVSPVLDSLARSRISGARLWKPAIDNGRKVAFRFYPSYFTYLPPADSGL